MAETFQEYAARLLSQARGRDPLDVLATTAARIRALIAGRTADALRRRPEPGRWSIAEIVAHLADAELVGAYRIRSILAAPGIALQPFDQDQWARSMRYAEADVSEALALFDAIRQAQVRLVRGVPDAELDRFGVHAERGPESVRYLLSLYAGHDLNHLAQIERQSGPG